MKKMTPEKLAELTEKYGKDAALAMYEASVDVDGPSETNSKSIVDTIEKGTNEILKQKNE